MTESLFTGLKVIDCASWIAGPAAATILSDFGADVIKIEPPDVGDPWRGRGPLPGRSVDYYWQLTSRNKRSLAIDLKHEGGIAALHRLAASADVSSPTSPCPSVIGSNCQPST
jgi:crotonobetainyl-CoA:carnitine CoA-transferase CaiB-like acyl-CoA transferase